MNIVEFKKLPLMGILRGVRPDVIDPLVEIVVSAGLKTIEITMNTDDAPRLIQQMHKASCGRLVIGAGTVLTLDDLKKAVDAGATFIVSPTFIPSIVEYCVDKSIPVFPGAFTPQEIFTAWSAGATMVKVFPAKFFGPTYFKEIKGPFQDIDLLACGGVSEDNISTFFSCGAAAIAFGGSIFKKEWLEKKDFIPIEGKIKNLIKNRGM